MGFAIYFTVILLAVIAAVYFFFQSRFNYWKKRGVPTLKPKFGLGNINLSGPYVHHAFMTKNIYDTFKGKSPIAGMYLSFSPEVVALDLDFIRNITSTDFATFPNRGFYMNEKSDPLSCHLFSLADEKWKDHRQKLTPTFSSGKMKFMYPTMLAVAEKLKNVLIKMAETEEFFEPKALYARFTTDVIGTCAFGLEANCLEDPNSEFNKMGALSFQINAPKVFLASRFRKFALFFDMRFFPKIPTDFFLKTVADTIQYREKNDIVRKDFMQLLLDIRKQDKIDGLASFTDNQLAAHAYVFFLGGFETSSTTLSFASYFLAKNTEIQEKCRQNINEVLDKHDGKITYESIAEMTYLDQVINETLRIAPPVPNHWREANANYTIPGTNIVIEKGTQVWIPVFAIQRDPDLYPNPEKFDPERFSKDNIRDRHPMAFTPFGAGPRLCLGERFGRMQVRLSLVTVLKNFRLKTTKKTPELTYDRKVLPLATYGPMYLSIEKI